MARHRRHWLACTLAAATFMGQSAAAWSFELDERLLEALKAERTSQIEQLIQDGADVDARDEYGATALAWAVMRDDAGAARQLLAAGADPNLADVNGITPLSIAVSHDSVALASMLLEAGADPNTARDTGETPLMTAVRLGSMELVSQLLSKGADPDASEARLGQTALMWAVDNPAMVATLLEAGADLRARSRSWDMMATRYAVELRPLGHGGDPWNFEGQYPVKGGGYDALLLAVQHRNHETVRLLLDAGADVNVAGADGVTPLIASLVGWRPAKNRAELAMASYARIGGNLIYDPDLELANALLDRGAQADVADEFGWTPMHGAVLSAVLTTPRGVYRLAFDAQRLSTAVPEPTQPPPNEAEVLALVQRLLDAGASLEPRTLAPRPGPVGGVRVDPTRDGSTPLHMAAGSYSVKLVNLLMERGADPNLLRDDGHTPFSVAVMSDDLSVVQAMVAGGADLQMLYSPVDRIADPDVEGVTETRSDQTILHIAAVPGASRLLEYLVSMGVPLEARNSMGETAYELAEQQERFRFALDHEGVKGNAPTVNPIRETHTTETFRRLLSQQAENSRASGEQISRANTAQAQVSAQ